MKCAAATPPRSRTGLFRMPIQRVFSAHGFGTVVTGIPVCGLGADRRRRRDPCRRPARQGPRTAGLPAAGTDRARRPLERDQRRDVDHHEVRRGCVAAAPGFFQPARMLGVRVQALAELGRPVENRPRSGCTRDR
jgi:selenocysteine-specific elongation factor